MKKIKNIICFLAGILVLCLYYRIVFSQTISINASSVIQPAHRGFGIQFHADQLLSANKIIFGTDENQWQNVHIPYLRQISPKINKMSIPIPYWEPELGQVTPDSDWMLALYKVLDEMKYEGCEIQFQEWRQHGSPWCDWFEKNYAPPEEIENFGKSLAKLMKHLTMEKGYYNIRAVCIWNEPDNYFATNSLLDDAYRACAKYFKQEGVGVKLNAPDSVQLNRAQDWREMMRHCFSVLDDACDEYSFNFYGETAGYDVYTEPAAVVADEATYSTDGKIEPIYIYEGEMAAGCGSDPAREGEYYVDIMRTGIAGVTKWWCMDHYFVFSAEALQSGCLMMWTCNTTTKQYSKNEKYWAHALGCKYSYNHASVLTTTVSGASGVKAGCLKDNDSDSYSIYVYNSGSSRSMTISINNGLNKTFQKYVHQQNDNCFTPVANVTMTNGSMTDTVPTGFTIYYGSGAKETTRPSAPSNLQITSLTPRKLKLTWSPATDNVRVARYNVYRNGNLAISINGTTWEDTHVSPNTSYSYEVKAVDGAGNESSTGATGNITTPQTTLPAPQAPSNLKIEDCLAEIEVSWTPVPGAKYYRVYEQIEGQSITRVSEIYGIENNPPKAYYVSYNGMWECNRENKRHFISVSAVNEEGTESPRSSSITVHVPYGQAMDFDQHYNFFADATASWDLGESLSENIKYGVYWGTFTITSSQNNFRTATIGFTPSQCKQVMIRMMNKTTRNTLQISWENNNGTYVDNIQIPITTNDTTFKEYVVDMTQKASWTSGTVSRVIFQFNGSGTGDVAISYIRIGTFPISKINVSKTNPNVGESITFDGSSSTPPPGGSINQYLWDFGDGQTGSGVNVSHSYSQAGYYTAKLTCKQDDLVWGEAKVTISVGNPVPLKVQGLDSIAANRTRIDLTWLKNNESDIQSYRIYRAQVADFTPGPSYLVATVPSSNDYYLDKGLSANTKYFYKITAVDTASQEGPASEVTECTTRLNDNLVINGDFETGSKNPWNGGTNWTVVNSGAHDGTYAYHGTGVVGGFDQTINTVSGSKYRLFCYIKVVSHTPSGSNSGNFSIWARHPTWNPTYSSLNHITGPIGKWQAWTFEFVPTNNQVLIQFLNWDNDTYDIYVDDIYVDLVPGAGNPPSAPTNLLCEGQNNPTNVTKTNPVLSWTFNDPDAGDNQSAYQVLVSTNQTNLNNNIGDAWNSGTVYSSQKQATYSGKPLILGRTYYWKVRTWDSSGAVSPYSSIAQWTVTASNNPPSAPTNLKCNGQTNPQGISDFIPDLSWTFVDSDSGQTQYAYQILVADSLTNINSDNGNIWNTNKVVSSANTIEFNGATLQPGLTYYWKVKTWDGFDAEGPYSSVANFSMTQSVTNNPPSAPTNLRCEGQVNPKNVSNFSPNLSWNFNDLDAGATQYAYRILVANSASALAGNNGNMWDTLKTTSSATTVKYAGTTLQPGTTYYWKVMTWDNFNAQSPYSADANFVMATGGGNNPVLTVDVTVLDFGLLDIGESRTLSFHIINPNPVFGNPLEGIIFAQEDWIKVSPESFRSDNQLVEVTVDNSILNMKEGDYTGKVIIITDNGEPKQLSIDVLVTATCVLPKPNPYNPDKGLLKFFGDGVVQGKTEIKIWTLSGELVRTLNSGNDSLGTPEELSWDGKDTNGKPVADGVYIFTYESPKERGIGKFTVIK